MPDENTNQPTPERSAQPDDRTSLQLPELSEIDMLSSKVQELESSVNYYKDQLLRKAAEFDNFKKRTENDYTGLIRYSTEDLIMKLLPVLDDFERSMKAYRALPVEQQTAGAFMEGVELIYTKFKRMLDAQGVKPFEVVGKPFDPHLHDALMQTPRADVPPHTVVDEVEKGYMLHDKVIRHAKVVVSAEPVTAASMGSQDRQ